MINDSASVVTMQVGSSSSDNDRIGISLPSATRAGLGLTSAGGGTVSDEFKNCLTVTATTSTSTGLAISFTDGNGNAFTYTDPDNKTPWVDNGDGRWPPPWINSGFRIIGCTNSGTLGVDGAMVFKPGTSVCWTGDGTDAGPTYAHWSALGAAQQADWASAVVAGDISTQANALSAMSSIDAALTSLNNFMGQVGAYQNRLQFTMENLQTGIQSYNASESTIRDADMAEEMTSFTKRQIVQQSGMAMLAQAMDSPRQILTLFRR